MMPTDYSAETTAAFRRIRTIATIALGITFVHVVFGAIVRISGSGMGGRCVARQVKTRSTARPMAGTIVQPISVTRLGIRIDADSEDPCIGARIAASIRAIWATMQQTTATQNNAVATAGETTGSMG
jgi:hypothetical protein